MSGRFERRLTTGPQSNITATHNHCSYRSILATRSLKLLEISRKFHRNSYTPSCPNHCYHLTAIWFVPVCYFLPVQWNGIAACDWNGFFCCTTQIGLLSYSVWTPSICSTLPYVKTHIYYRYCCCCCSRCYCWMITSDNLYSFYTFKNQILAGKHVTCFAKMFE